MDLSLTKSRSQKLIYSSYITSTL